MNLQWQPPGAEIINVQRLIANARGSAERKPRRRAKKGGN